jgi:hypothetical protein
MGLVLRNEHFLYFAGDKDAFVDEFGIPSFSYYTSELKHSKYQCGRKKLVLAPLDTMCVYPVGDNVLDLSMKLMTDHDTVSSEKRIIDSIKPSIVSQGTVDIGEAIKESETPSLMDITHLNVDKQTASRL